MVMLSMFMVILNMMRHQMAIKCLVILSGNLWLVGDWMNLEESHLPQSSASPFLPRLVGHIGITWYWHWHHIGITCRLFEKERVFFDSRVTFQKHL